MHYRYFKKRPHAKWGGDGAFRDDSGWIWVNQWNFKTVLAATRAAAFHFRADFVLTRQDARSTNVVKEKE